MACTVEGNQLYCTTADVHFGPGFDSYEEAYAFRSWCYEHHGDPRQASLDLDALKVEWETKYRTGSCGGCQTAERIYGLGALCYRHGS